MAAVDERLATGASYALVELIRLAQRVNSQLPGEIVRLHLEKAVEAGKAARIPFGDGDVRYQRRVGKPLR